VLEHISNGLSTNDIAQQLNISNNTVEFHRHNLMKKLSANNMAQLVKKAIQLGLNFIK
jgi:DNA-binding NarL/FixJ family response regulator